MFNIKTNYIILFWIIALILFTFYCIFRLSYLKEKYDNTISPIITMNSTLPNTNNIISYINNIQSKHKITDVPGCENVFDDNIAVQSLGYNNCQSGYSDYLSKNLDINKKYGQPKSLSDMCPVSSKSEEYSRCLQKLMHKFSDNANILDNITSDMTSSINKRLQDRSNSLNEIQLSMNSLIYNKEQNNFRTNMLVNGDVAKYPDEVIGLVNKYYKNRYQEGAGIEKFSANISTYIVDPKLESTFFGTYSPLSGQFLAFNDLIITLGYDESQNTYGSDYNVINSDTNKNTNTNIILTLSSYNNSLNIIYKVSSIKNYEKRKNAIILNITDENIKDDSMSDQENNSQTLQQLINILGIVVPTQLIISYETFTSTENITRSTYKLSNGNLDTIVVLNKI